MNSIDENFNDDILISISGTEILINTDGNENIYTYDISGRIVGEGDVVSVNYPGIYMIKVGNKIRKVLIEF